mgnify:FL=1
MDTTLSSIQPDWDEACTEFRDAVEGFVTLLKSNSPDSLCKKTAVAETRVSLTQLLKHMTFTSPCFEVTPPGYRSQHRRYRDPL